MNHNSGGGALDIDIHQAGLDSAFTYDGLHLPGDIAETVAGRGGYLDGLLQLL